MDEQEQIEYQDVMDALTGVKTFIPGTFIFQKWQGPKGRFQVRYKVVSRTAKTVTVVQMPASEGYGYVDRLSEPFRIRVTANTYLGCEWSRRHILLAKARCA